MTGAYILRRESAPPEMQVPSKFVWMKWAASSFFLWCPIDSHTCSFSFLMSHNFTEPSWEQLNSEFALFQFSEIPITGSLWALKHSTIFLSSKILMLQSSYAPMTHRGWEMSLTLNESNTCWQKDWHQFCSSVHSQSFEFQYRNEPTSCC